MAKPNILLIVSGDHGGAHTGFIGCKDLPPPPLDSLALESPGQSAPDEP